MWGDQSCSGNGVAFAEGLALVEKRRDKKMAFSIRRLSEISLKWDLRCGLDTGLALLSGMNILHSQLCPTRIINPLFLAGVS